MMPAMIPWPSLLLKWDYTSIVEMGLHPDSPLRSSLTRRPPKIVWALMKKVEEYCKVEDDTLRIRAGYKVVVTATLTLVQPISAAPPERSPELKGRPKRENRRDPRRLSEKYSCRSSK
ncbi:hypothetical protein CsSME_00010748 [Camellia sinensis var. sinensis]